MTENLTPDISHNLFRDLINNRHPEIAANPQKQGQTDHHQNRSVQKGRVFCG